MLNENLTTDSSKNRASNTTVLTATDANSSTTPVIQKPGDAAIAGVIQLTVAEWYWGESDQDLRYHLMGLRDMIRVRGGFNQLGMDGLLAKNAIVCVELFYCFNYCMLFGLTLLRLFIIPLIVDICLVMHLSFLLVYRMSVHFVYFTSRIVAASFILPFRYFSRTQYLPPYLPCFHLSVRPSLVLFSL